MLIKFWGARGSVPVSGKDYVRYGGDTTCVEIRSAGGELIIVDAGTGIRRLGNKLLEEKCRSFSILFTHSHWDHVMGFPFFYPIYSKGTEIHMLGCPFAQNAVKEMISKTMQPPSFPVKFDEVSARFVFSEICTDSFSIGGITVHPILTSHPNHGMGYRFTEGDTSFVFLTDNELGYTHPGGLAFRDYEEFSRGADLLVHDSEFLQEEYDKKRTWGHSTINQALDLAIMARVKRFGLFHHNQDRTDSQIDDMVAQCRGRIRRENSPMECFAAASDMEIILSGDRVS